MYNRSETDEEKQTVEELNVKLNEKYIELKPGLDILYESLNDVPVYDSYNGIKNYDDYDMVYEG